SPLCVALLVLNAHYLLLFSQFHCSQIVARSSLVNSRCSLFALSQKGHSEQSITIFTVAISRALLSLQIMEERTGPPVSCGNNEEYKLPTKYHTKCPPKTYNIFAVL